MNLGMKERVVRARLTCTQREENEFKYGSGLRDSFTARCKTNPNLSTLLPCHYLLYLFALEPTTPAADEARTA